MSATLEPTSSQVSPLEFDEIPDKDSPEYRTYYYQRFREACYHQLQCLDSEHKIKKYWLSIDETKQRVLVDRMMMGVAFQPDVDFDDSAFMNRVTYAISLQVITEANRRRTIKTERTKAGNGGNPLLRRAIARSAILKNPQPGLRISGY